jgi:hypothetical protein
MLSGGAEPLLDDFAVRGTVLLYFRKRKGVIRRFVQNCPLSGQGRELSSNLA